MTVMVQRSRWWQLGITLLGSSLLLFSAVGCAYSEEAAAESNTVPANVASQPADNLQRLQAADVVYLGERHDSVADHNAQLAIIEALYAENPDLAIAMEMFQRPFQDALDRYIAGEISEAELIAQSEYESRWGFPWEYYAPILRFAQAHQLPVIALNAPAEITRQVAREGLESLEGDDLRYIPPVSEIDTSNQDYQDFVASVFGSHGGHGNLNFDNFFAAQVVWDETMAMSIAKFREANPTTQIVVLAGQGHVIYGYGIPDRVARRLGDRVTQQIVLLNPAPSVIADDPDAIADVLWYSP